MTMLPKMMKSFQILAVLSAILVEFQCLSYGQQYSASLGKAPVGVISRFLTNGEKEIYSSLGYAKVGVYRKREFPVISPFYYPQYRPIYQPTYLSSYQAQLKTKSKPISESLGTWVAGRNSAITNHNSLVGGINLSNLLGLGGLLGK